MHPSTMAAIERQLQENLAGLNVALLALGIDQEEMARDPDAAATAAVTFSNGALCQVSVSQRC
jgi:hypothetical protein